MFGADPTTILLATSLATAVAGAAVASLAYRGYQRNDSEAMRYLAVGIAFVTVGPFVVGYGLSPVAGISDAATLLGVFLATIAGILSMLYSLEGT